MSTHPWEFAPPRREAASPSQTADRGRIRVRTDRPVVLVVDDDPDARDVMSTVLSRDGYAIATASDGEEALALIGEVVPSLIVLDIRMPRMDGFAFDRARRRRPSASLVPVIVVSASDEEDAIVRGVRPDAYLRKPLDLEELRTTVSEILDEGFRRKRR